MKSKEDYLIQYEDRLIEKLESNYSDLNRNILYCFSLTFVFILFEFRLLEDASIFGIQLSLTKEQLLVIMPLVIIVPYFLVNNCVLNIARIVNRLIDNSEELKKINNNSRPFRTEDLEFLSQGIGGLQLHFSKWIVTNYLTDRKFQLKVETPNSDTLKKNLVYNTFTI